MKMKLVFVISSLVTGFLSAQESKLKTELKEKLYIRQCGLMEKERYEQFIEPYLQEAETTLKAAQYCVAHQDCALCKQYTEAMLNLNVACFYKHMAQSAVASKRVADVAEFKQRADTLNLSHVVADFPQEAGITDTRKEVTRTVELLEKANKEYYNQFGWAIKGLIFIQTILNR